MGEFEAYCQLCGGPLYNPHATPLNDGKASEISMEEATTGERRMLPHEGSWLNSARVLGYLNNEIRSMKKGRSFWHETGRRYSFVSSVGTGGVCSDLEVSGLERGIMLYSGRVAVHDSCYHLLRHAIEHVQHLWCVRGLVELDVLVGCMISLSDDVYGMALHTTLDLGGAEMFRGIHGWEGNCTSEAWYLTDYLVECEGVSEYVENPPRADGWPGELEKTMAMRRWRHRQWRCFGFGTGTAPDAMEIDVDDKPPPHQPLLEALPTELLVQILCFLPQKDVKSLCFASKTVAAISLPQEYWKSRFVVDAPYLWELHARMPMLEWMRPAPDWRRMYQDLIAGNKTQLAFRGLRNRERVWRAAIEVAEECWIGELCEREERGSYIRPATTYHSGPDAPRWDDGG